MTGRESDRDARRDGPGRVGLFASDRSGGVLTLAGLMLPAMAAFVSFAVDYAVASFDHTALQKATDATAISLARELTLARPDDARMQSIGEIIARQHLEVHGLDAGVTVTSKVGDRGTRVTVSISRPRRRFMTLFRESEGDLAARATAAVSGLRQICVVALDPGASQAVYLKSNSILSAERCDVHSNSESGSGIETDSGIRVTASRTCSAGGFRGAGQFSGEKVADCPAVPDPLLTRPPVQAGTCTHRNLEVIDKGRATGRHMLYPGTYCGGLFIGGNSFVQFAPGVYVVKDGPLVVDSNADIRGAYVGFMLTGRDAAYRFLSNARVWLDAPRDGPLAGILFYEDRASEAGRLHEIKSNFVSNLTGTIYLPRGKFVVDATNDVSQRSAFTIIVANQFLLTANPRLYLNTDYALTDVPVPAGLGKVDGPPRLIE